jgi:hypothetical protein
MSQEVAAAILTQAYFQCSKTAAEGVEREVNQTPAKPAPVEGGIATVVKTYAKVLEMMDKLPAPK